MNFVILFFRDVLDGPLYIVVAILCGILICSCIGYLGERYLKKQETKKMYEETHAAITGETSNVSVNSTVDIQQPTDVTTLGQGVVEETNTTVNGTIQSQ